MSGAERKTFEFDVPTVSIQPNTLLHVPFHGPFPERISAISDGFKTILSLTIGLKNMTETLDGIHKIVPCDRVVIQLGDQAIDLEPSNARHVANKLLECAHAVDCAEKDVDPTLHPSLFDLLTRLKP